MYNVAEQSDLAHDVYQDDHCSTTEHEVREGDGDGAEAEANIQSGGSTRFEGHLDELIRNRRLPNIAVDEDEDEDEDEDDTIMEYLSDGGNENAEDDSEDDNLGGENDGLCGENEDPCTWFIFLNLMVLLIFSTKKC
jgi:hypothetical protein